MSKVLVDRELLELLRNFTFLHDDGCAGALRGNIDKALAARPAEEEGVVAWAPSTALEKLRNRHNNAPCVLTDGPAEFNDVPLVPLAALSAVTAERDRLATENERLARDAKNDAIAYKAVIERQEELRAELDAIRAQRGEPVAEIVKCEPYEDGSTNPHNTVNWFGLNAENDLPAGTKLYATP